MDTFLHFLLTIAIGFAGAFLAKKLKVPAGGLLGAMVFVIIFNFFTNMGTFPSDLRTVLQIFSGTMIGAKITKSDVRDLKKIILPIFIMVACLLIINISLGMLMYAVSDINLATCLFAVAPGGLTDMAIISEELGANPALVAVLQTFRLMLIYIIMIPTFKKLITKGDTAKKIQENAMKQAAAPVLEKGEAFRRFLMTIACAAVLGVIFWKLGISAGAMIGAMIASAMVNIFTGKAYFYKGASFYIQAVAGSYIGTTMDHETIIALKGLVLPAFIMLLAVLAYSFITANAIRKFAKIDYGTSLLASSPGGIQEMSILADDFGVDAPKVAILQTMRIVIVIMIFPTMMRFVTGFFA